jgi:hypothetical protein
MLESRCLFKRPENYIVPANSPYSCINEVQWTNYMGLNYVLFNENLVHNSFSGLGRNEIFTHVVNIFSNQTLYFSYEHLRTTKISKNVRKGYPRSRPCRPIPLWDVKVSHYLHSLLIDFGEVSLANRPLSTPQKYFHIFLCYWFL